MEFYVPFYGAIKKCVQFHKLKNNCDKSGSEALRRAKNLC